MDAETPECDDTTRREGESPRKTLKELLLSDEDRFGIRSAAARSVEISPNHSLRG